MSPSNKDSATADEISIHNVFSKRYVPDEMNETLNLTWHDVYCGDFYRTFNRSSLQSVHDKW